MFFFSLNSFPGKWNGWTASKCWQASSLKAIIIDQKLLEGTKLCSLFFSKAQGNLVFIVKKIASHFWL